MITVFKYKNKKGDESIKAIALIGKDANGFAGISLGKIMFNSEFSIDDVLRDYCGYKVLDHIPVGKRGQASTEPKEGMSKYNVAFKRFVKSGVVSVIANLNCVPENIEAIKKIIEAIKSLDSFDKELPKEPELPPVTESVNTGWIKEFEKLYECEFSQTPGQKANLSAVTYDDLMSAFEKGVKGEPLYGDKDFDDTLYSSSDEYDEYENAYNCGQEYAGFDL